MPRPSDWNVLGLHGDPTPGDPGQIRQLVDDLVKIGTQARSIAQAIDQVMNTADSSVFAGKTADALRGKVDDRLRNHINDVADSFWEVSQNLGGWANHIEEAQRKADGALSAARGLAEDDPQLEVLRQTAQSAGTELDSVGDSIANAISSASDIRLPISDCQVFWEMFQILAIILIVPALIFGGPVALLALGVNMTLFIKAAIDFAHGDIGFLDLFLAGLGIIAPTTKALPIFAIGGLLKNGYKAVIQFASKSLLPSLKDIASGFRFATVLTGLRDIARISMTWVRQGGLWVMQNFHNLPALGGTLFVKGGLVVAQGIRSIPVVVRGWGSAIQAGAPGAWKNFRVFTQETWSSQMGGAKWTRLLLPVTHTDIAEFGLKGALRIGFWDRGVMGRGVWDIPVGGTVAHTASAVPMGPHGATSHLDLGHANINMARMDLENVRFGNFAETHTSIRPSSFSVAPVSTVDLSGLRVGTVNPVSVHGASAVMDNSMAGFRAVRHMDDVVDIAGTQMSRMRIDAFDAAPGQMGGGLGVSAAAPDGVVTHSGLYVPGSAGAPAVHEGVDVAALVAKGNGGNLLTQSPAGLLTAPPGGTGALHTALTGVPAPAPGSTAIHDVLTAPGTPGAGAAHSTLTGVQAPPSGGAVHDLLAAPGGTAGTHGPLTGVPGHQSGAGAGGSAFDLLSSGSKATPNNPVPAHIGTSLSDNTAGAARANQAHLALDDIVRPAGSGRPGSVVTDAVHGSPTPGAPGAGLPKGGAHGTPPQNPARSALDLLDDGRGARPVDGPAFAGAAGAGKATDVDTGHAFAGAPAKSTDDVVVTPGTHDKPAVTGEGRGVVPLRQEPVPTPSAASGGGHVLSRETDLLHEVNLKLGKMGAGAVTVETVTAARQALEDLRGAAFTKVDVRAQADQLAVHLAGQERAKLPGGVRDPHIADDTPLTAGAGGHHAPPVPPRPEGGLLDGLDDLVLDEHGAPVHVHLGADDGSLPATPAGGLDDMVLDDTGAPMRSHFDMDDDPVPGTPVGEHGTQDLDGFAQFVDLLRPLRRHLEEAIDNPAANIEVALVANPGGRTWREFSDDVGHAMVSVMLPGERTPHTIGFYPGSDGQLFGRPGALVDDADYLLSGHVRVLGTYRITAEQLFRGYEYALGRSGATYDLFRYNCVRFAEGFVSAALGKNVADLWVAAPYRLVDAMLSPNGAWHWADGTGPVAKLTAEDAMRYQDAFLDVNDLRRVANDQVDAAMDQARHFVLFDHQRPLVNGLPTIAQKERLGLLGQFETMITHTILTSGDDAGRQLSRQLGDAYGTLRPGLDDLPAPSVPASLAGDSLPGVGRGSVDSVPDPVSSPGGSGAGHSFTDVPQSPVHHAPEMQRMLDDIDGMLHEMGVSRTSLDDLPSGPPSPAHSGAAGDDVHVAAGGETHAPVVDKGKGKAPADISGSSGLGGDHDGVRVSAADDLSDIDAAAAISDARRDLINARTIRDNLQTRYVDGVGTSAEMDGVRYLESWEQVRQADAALAQAEAHWTELTGGAPLPEVQAFSGHGLGGGAPRLPQGLRSLLHLGGRADDLPPAPQGIVQSVDHVPSATHVVTPLEGGGLSHALVPSGQDLTVAHWLSEPQSLHGWPKSAGKEAYQGDLQAYGNVLSEGLARAEDGSALKSALVQQQKSFQENVDLFRALEGRTELRNLRMPQLAAIVMAERRALRTLSADADLLAGKLRSGEWKWAEDYPLEGAQADELIAKVHRHLQEDLSLTVNLKIGDRLPNGGTLLDAMTGNEQLLRNAWETNTAGAGYFVTRGNVEETLGLPASVKRTTEASGIYPGPAGAHFAPTAGDLVDLPNYAALTSKYRPSGVKMYGQAVFHLKSDVMQRATFTPADSFSDGLQGARSVTGNGNMLPLLNHGHEPLVRLAFAEATDFQYDSAFRGFRDAGTLERRLARYFEAQIHGGVKWDDLDRVVLVNDGFNPAALQAQKLQLEQFAQARGLSFTVEVHDARLGVAPAPGVHPAPPAAGGSGGAHSGGAGDIAPSSGRGPVPSGGHLGGGPDAPPAAGGTSGAAVDGVHESYGDLHFTASLLDEHGVPRDDLFGGTAARVGESGDASFVSPSAPSVPSASSGSAVPRLSGDGILDVVTGAGGRNGGEARRTLGGFEFGAGTRNNDGKNLVSRPIVVTVKDGGTEARVAVHLNVMLSSGNEADVVTDGVRLENASEVTIHGSKFHLTARPHGDQNLIDVHGASSGTAANSIHVGPSNAKAGWNNRPANTGNLANALGVSEQKLVEALERRFPPGELVDTVYRFQDDVKHAVVHGSGAQEVRVRFTGDKSFPVRGEAGGVSARAVPVPVHGVDDVLAGSGAGAGRVDLRLVPGWDAARGAAVPRSVQQSWVDPVSTPRGGGAHAPRYEVRSGFDVRTFSVGDRSVTDLTVRVRLVGGGLSPAQLDALWERALGGVERVFNRPGEVLPDGSVLHVTLERVGGGASDAHLSVRVGSDGAMNQHQWRVDATEQDLAHELGHQLGLRDEYRDTTAGHRPEIDGSLMGNYHNAAPEGLSHGGLRSRYLELIHTQIAAHDPVHVPHVGVDGVDGVSAAAPSSGKGKAKAGASGSVVVPPTFTRHVDAGRFTDGYQRVAGHYELKPLAQYDGAAKGSLRGGEGTRFVATVIATPDTDLLALAKTYGTAFGKDVVGERLGLVIGVNGRVGKADEIAGAVEKFAKQWEKEGDFAVSVTGFTWRQPDPKLVTAGAQKEIPYGALREAVVRDDLTRGMLDRLRADAKGEVYLHVGDADVRSMVVGGRPLFERAAARIESLAAENGLAPEMVSGGYTLPGGVAKNAADLDLAVRDAMAKTDARAIYFPEPNTFIRVDPDNSLGLEKDIRFGEVNSTGGVKSYEAREGERLLDSLVRNRGHYWAGRENQAVVFDSGLALVTDGERIAREVGSDPRSILSGLTQSHANAKTWTEQIEHYLQLHHPQVLANDSHAGKNLAAIAFHDIKADSAKNLSIKASDLGTALKTEWKALIKASGGPNDTFKQLVGMAVDTRNALVDGINEIRRPGRVSPSAPSVPSASSGSAVPRLSGDGILDVVTGAGGRNGGEARRTLGGFEFGAGTRNNDGKNLVSRPIVVTVKDGGTEARVAVHLNVMLSSGNEADVVTDGVRLENASEVTIHGSKFHLTARPHGDQNLIDVHGASSGTAANSIHVGPSNAKAGWNNRPANTGNLANALGVSEQKLVEALERRFPPGELVDTVYRFQDDVKHAVVHGSGAQEVRVRFTGDKSFPVRGEAGGVSARAVPVPVHGVDDVLAGSGAGAGRVDLRLVPGWDAARGAAVPRSVQQSWVDPVSTPRGGGAHALRYEVRSGFDVRTFSVGDRSVTDLTVRVRLVGGGLSPAQLDALWERALGGVERVFNRPGEVLPDGSVLHVTLERVGGGASDAHLSVRVGLDGAMNQHQWRVDATEQDLAHELGHQLGLRDEYRDTTAGHRPEVDGSLMGNYHNAAPEGLSHGGLRSRYLELIHTQIRNHDHVHTPHVTSAADDAVPPSSPTRNQMPAGADALTEMDAAEAVQDAVRNLAQANKRLQELEALDLLGTGSSSGNALDAARGQVRAAEIRLREASAVEVRLNAAEDALTTPVPPVPPASQLDDASSTTGTFHSVSDSDSISEVETFHSRDTDSLSETATFHSVGEYVSEVTEPGLRQVDGAGGTFTRYDEHGALVATGRPLPELPGVPDGLHLVTPPQGASWLEDASGTRIVHVGDQEVTATDHGLRMTYAGTGGPRDGEFIELGADGSLVKQGFNVLDRGRSTSYQYVLDHSSGLWQRTGRDGVGTGVFHHGTADLKGAANGRVVLLSATGAPVPVFERRPLPGGGVLDSFRRTDTIDFGRTNPRTHWARWDEDGVLSGTGIREYDTAGTGWRDLDGRGNVVHEYQAGLQKHGNGTGHTLALTNADGELRWHRYDGASRELAEGPRTPDRHDNGWTDHLAGDGQTVAQRKWGMGHLPERAGQYEEHTLVQDPGAPGGWKADGTWQRQSPHGKEVGKAERVDGALLVTERWSEQRPPVWVRKAWLPGARNADNAYAHVLGDNTYQLFTWEKRPIGTAAGEGTSGVRYVGFDGGILDLTAEGDFARLTTKLHDGTTLKVGDHAKRPAYAPAAPGHQPWEAGKLTGYRVPKDPATDGMHWQDVFRGTDGQIRVAREGLPGGHVLEYRDPPLVGTPTGLGAWVARDAHGNVTGMRQANPDGRGNSFIEGTGKPGSAKWTWREQDAKGGALGPSGTRQFFRGSNDWKLSWDDSFRDFDAQGNLVRERRMLDNGAYVDAWRDGNGRWLARKYGKDGGPVGPEPQVRSWWNGTAWQDQWLRGAQRFRDEVRPLPGGGAPVRLREVPEGHGGPLRVREYDIAATTPHAEWKEFDHGSVVRERRAERAADGSVTYLETDAWRGQWNRYDSTGGLLAQRTDSGLVWERNPLGQMKLVGNEYDYRGPLSEIRGWGRRVREAQRMPWSGTVLPDGLGALREARYRPYWQVVGGKALVEFGQEFVLEFAANLVVNAIVDAAQHKQFNGDDVLKAFANAAVSSGVKTGVGIAVHENRAPGLRELGNLKTTLANIDSGKHPQRRPFNHEKTWTNEWAGNETPTRWRGGTYDFFFSAGTSTISGWVNGAMNAAVWGVSDANGNTVKLSGADAFLDGGINATAALTTSASTALVKNLVVMSGGSRLFHRQGFADFWIQLPFKIFEKSIQSIYLTGAFRASINPSWYQVPPAGTQQQE